MSVQDLIQRCFPDDPMWKHLRTVSAAAGPTFTDETDWAGGGTVPSESACIAVGNTTDDSTSDLGTVVLYAVVTTASAAAIVARGSMAFSVQAIEVVGRTHQKRMSTSHPLLPDHAIDSASLAAIPQRKLIVSGRNIQRMAFRLHTFSGVPGTAAELHLLYRLE